MNAVSKAALVAALLAGTSATSHAALTIIDRPLMTSGNLLTAIYVFADAGDTSRLFAGLGTAGQFLFTNHPATPPGSSVVLDPAPAAGPLHFTLQYLSVANSFTTGIAHPDDSAHPFHAKASTTFADFGVGDLPAAAARTIADLGGSILFVGFEDRIGGDYDYNDLIFAFSNLSTPVATVAEPATLAVMGAGLLGLGLARRRRRG